MLTERAVQVAAGAATLEGNLTVPAGARGLVLFAHGSGSSRHSPRNRFVASMLQEGGLATLLVDLLTAEEEALDQRSGALRFDTDMLGRRVIGAVDWVAGHPDFERQAVGIFGASTGAAGALLAAAARPERVRAVVSRGGRPDLVGEVAPAVRAPTLLIVGEHDRAVLKLNRQVYEQLPEPKRLEVVPGASHLFEEPGALERVAELAAAWFTEHLRGTRP